MPIRSLTHGAQRAQNSITDAAVRLRHQELGEAVREGGRLFRAEKERRRPHDEITEGRCGSAARHAAPDSDIRRYRWRVDGPLGRVVVIQRRCSLEQLKRQPRQEVWDEGRERVLAGRVIKRRIDCVDEAC